STTTIRSGCRCVPQPTVTCPWINRSSTRSRTMGIFLRASGSRRAGAALIGRAPAGGLTAALDAGGRVADGWAAPRQQALDQLGWRQVAMQHEVQEHREVQAPDDDDLRLSAGARAR